MGESLKGELLENESSRSCAVVPAELYVPDILPLAFIYELWEPRTLSLLCHRGLAG